jgi:hypothetical protein
MRVERSDQGARRARKGRALRVGVLLGVVAGLLVFLLAHDSAPNGRLVDCVGQAGAPEVRSVAPQALSPLRGDIARIAPQRIARLYEEGAVMARSAWTDEPPAPPAVSPSARRPDGYEMRWWAPNGDDLVADELVFANAAAADRFVQMASSPRCRARSERKTASSPPRGLNLSWLNPDGVAQADVFFARGSRVYRVADAPAGQHRGEVRAGSVSRAFSLIDALACLLPGAHCVQEHQGGVLS